MSDFAMQFVPGGEAAPAPTQPKPQSRTSGVAQFGAGLNEGLADLAGMPVDLATMAVNLGIKGVNAMGANIPTIDNPVGGSGTFRQAAQPLTSMAGDPQNIGQRYARRAGREMGFGIPAATMMTAAPGIGPAAMSNLPRYAAGSVAGDLGAAAGGQTARELFPESDLADFVGSLAGGVGGAATTATKSRAPAPTRDSWKAQADANYDIVRGPDGELTPAASQRYTQAITDRLEAEGGDIVSSPKAATQVGRLGRAPRLDIMDIEEARRRFRDHVARSSDEEVMGQILMDETDAYLKSLEPKDIAGSDPQGIVDALGNARRQAAVYIKHDTVKDALDAAKRSADNSGTGGNILNRQSQEIAKIYENEVRRRPSSPSGTKGRNKSGGYTADEVEAMRRIVDPSRGERFLRGVGRWSPGTGGLSSMAGAGGVGGALMGYATTQNPMFLAGAAPALTGYIAQTAAERMKSKHIEELIDTILRGGKATPKKMPDAAKAAIAAALLKQAVPN